MQFWNFPKVKKSIYIDVKRKKLFIDDRKFRIPILFELNDKLETTPKFEFSLSKKRIEKIGFNSHISKMNSNESFILIESCSRTNALIDETDALINKTINYTGFCLLAGKASKYYVHTNLKSYTELSTKEIREITGLE